MIKKLDFIIIGTQKGGTTSFNLYLASHPGIEIPATKEAPFFSLDSVYQEGWEYYAEQNFINASNEKLWGKTTPHYMCDSRSAERIYSYNCNIKLVAILRNPINRAFSHYQMCVRRGWEKRTFNQTVEELLREDNLIKSRCLVDKKINETLCYLVWGEYGRILSNYLSFFPKKQLLILFSEDLNNQPVETFQKALSFLSINSSFVPSNINKKYHVGNQEDMIASFKRIPGSYLLWNRLSNNLRIIIKRQISFWHDSWQNNSKDNQKKMKMTVQTRQRLANFYSEDLKLLTRLFEIDLPWEDFKKY